MTPGFAKPRSQLPWLPYSESDRVIINSHNFTSPWTPAVNGKMPIGAWCPSRDTAGNGTTTLTDLVGSNNGTLTNFALSGSTSNWVADTDAGGVRALDFDGVNDYVDCGTSLGTSLGSRTAFSWSVWTYLRTVSANDGVLYFGNFASSQGVFQFIHGAGFVQIRANSTAYDKFAGGASWVNTWVHNLVTYDGANITFYKNGSAVAALSAAFTQTINFTGLKFTIGAYYSSGFTSDSRLDDIRIWDQALDSTDASDLYTALRGGQA